MKFLKCHLLSAPDCHPQLMTPGSRAQGSVAGQEIELGASLGRPGWRAVSRAPHSSARLVEGQRLDTEVTAVRTGAGQKSSFQPVRFRNCHSHLALLRGFSGQKWEQTLCPVSAASSGGAASLPQRGEGRVLARAASAPARRLGLHLLESTEGK